MGSQPSVGHIVRYLWQKREARKWISVTEQWLHAHILEQFYYGIYGARLKYSELQWFVKIVLGDLWEEKEVNKGNVLGSCVNLSVLEQGGVG